MDNESDTDSFDDFASKAATRYALLIVHEVIFVIFCVVGICINITIINTVYGFNRMRTASNMFFANWAIADILSLLLTPTAYDIIAGLTRFVGYLPLLERLGMIMHTTEIICVAIVTIDWFLGAFFQKASDQYRKYYKYVMGLPWLYAIITILLTVTVCRKRWTCRMAGIEILFCYLGLALILLIVQSWRGVQKCRGRPTEQPGLFLNLASIFIITWAFGFTNISILHWVVFHPLISIIFDCFTFSTPIVNFLLLYYFNQDFQACFVQALSRSSDKYTEELTNVPETVPDSIDNSAFHSVTNVL